MWKAKIIATGVLYHMASLQIYKIFVQISYIVWETSSNNILRFLANSNFLNQQKGRGSLSVRRMNLRSHETSVSIVTQAIAQGIFNQFLMPFSAKHFKRSIYPIILNVKLSTRKKVAEIFKIKLKQIIPIES